MIGLIRWNIHDISLIALIFMIGKLNRFRDLFVLVRGIVNLMIFKCQTLCRKMNWMIYDSMIQHVHFQQEAIQNYLLYTHFVRSNQLVILVSKPCHTAVALRGTPGGLEVLSRFGSSKMRGKLDPP